MRGEGRERDEGGKGGKGMRGEGRERDEGGREGKG